MSISGATNHNKRLPSEAEHAQRPMAAEEVQQQLKMRERQRFFEEVVQHDVDFYLSTAHLHIDNKKPPMGSISSMEVNVDMLEQMDLMDISDHEALDVFLNSGSDGSALTSPPPEDDDDVALEEDEDKEVVYREGQPEVKSRISSTSSGSTDPYSLDTSEGGVDTPVVQSDEEEVQVDNFLLASTGSAKEDDLDEEEEEEEDLPGQLS